MESKTLDAFERLSDILDTLRRECPWDRQQTMKSLRYLTIEEVHELSEAIIALESSEVGGRKSEVADATQTSDLRPLTSNLKKELGDVAMHILFYCKLAEDQGLFTTADVYNAISDKLVARHPFIYDKENYHGENWEQLKMREGRKNVLDGVPASLPTLVKTVRMQEKVFGYADTLLSQAQAPASSPNLGEQPDSETLPTNSSPKLGEGDPSEARVEECVKHVSNEEQFGDLLFDLVDWGRRHGINADDALSLANRRFADLHSR